MRFVVHSSSGSDRADRSFSILVEVDPAGHVRSSAVDAKDAAFLVCARVLQIESKTTPETLCAGIEGFSLRGRWMSFRPGCLSATIVPRLPPEGFLDALDAELEMHPKGKSDDRILLMRDAAGEVLGVVGEEAYLLWHEHRGVENRRERGMNEDPRDEAQGVPIAQALLRARGETGADAVALRLTCLQAFSDGTEKRFAGGGSGGRAILRLLEEGGAWSARPKAGTSLRPLRVGPSPLLDSVRIEDGGGRWIVPEAASTALAEASDAACLWALRGLASDAETLGRLAAAVPAGARTGFVEAVGFSAHEKLVGAVLAAALATTPPSV